jgi:CRP-like cAMP-binding protein/Fe-S-cluster-containing dehydrogenase component
MSASVQMVKLTIDGQEIEVPATKTAYDPQYKKNIEIPTTIYDAARELSQKTGGQNPIPILCHREHVNPVAVCRVCVVEVGGRVLAPACQRACDPGMKVQTANTSEKVKTAVKVVTELLLADQPPEQETKEGSNPNELLQLASRLGLNPKTPRFPRRTHDRGRDDSSLVIAVDHNACILCDRCIRGCNEIRDNQILGRMGKGYTAKIAFDLNDPMGSSGCVACGECMISCPTGALTFRTPIKAARGPETPKGGERVTPSALAQLPLFEGVAEKFLEWNANSVLRRTFKAGEVVCKEGEHGASAFYIEKGRVEVRIQSSLNHVKSRKGKGDNVNKGLFGLVRRFTTGLASRTEDSREGEGKERYIHIDAPVALKYGDPVAQLKAGDLFGEMTCMNSYPRSATVRALEDCTMLEIQRNVLYIIQRNKKSRALLEQTYRTRSIDTHLRSVDVFASLLKDDKQFEDFVTYLRDRVELMRLPPGQVIFKQNDPADHFYLVRIGFVKVSQKRAGGERVLTYVGPGGYIGEIGLMANIPEISAMAPAGVRVATCTALDHVDLVRISGEDFQEILTRFPGVKEHLVKIAEDRLKQNEADRKKVETESLGTFLEQGLMNAKSLLVIDLERCTRCDECTKACADSHDGVTRLIRDGLRFDKYLVASSCRSCLDPYCMVGCPVNSIKRRSTGEMIIEDHCIGCGKCSENCPYGNINMHPFEEKREDPRNPGKKIPVVQMKATMCDLCSGLDGQPSCVYACPHDAAFRFEGGEFRKLVEGQRK